MAYPNGRVPSDKLITFASGWLPGEGTWYHQLPPGTYAKHLTLVALAKRNTGRTLQISEGWGAYRPYDIQVYAKEKHGQWAATPGKSSHGMFWEGIVCAAIDYGNWGYVYNWDRAAFYRDVRAVGLVPGLIHPSRNRTYPDEPWHVVDKKPWAAGAATGGGAVPFAPTIDVGPEEDDMKLLYVTDSVDGNGVPGWALLNTRTGKLVTLRSTGAGAQENANSWARVWGKSLSVTRQDMLNAIAAIQKTA